MIFLPTSILILLYTFQSTSFASAQSSSSPGTYTLPNETASFIPTCAQTCFISFLESNFPAVVCSMSPTLDCLCSHNGTLGYTVGEGALQCILTEQNEGSCQGNSNTTGALAAYNMCVGKPNALPNTHATITATLVVHTSQPGVVLIEATSTVENTATRITSENVQTATDSIVSSTGLATTPVSSGTIANYTLEAASQTAQSVGAPTGLTGPQVAGIAVGGSVAAVLAIGGLIIFACLRRREALSYDDRRSDFGTFQVERGNSMEHSYGMQMDSNFSEKHRHGDTTSGIQKRVPPVVPPRVTMEPNMFSRRSIPAEEIGVAISPEMNRSPDMELEWKHSSRLLPEKPAAPKLSIVVPGQPTATHRHPQIPANKSFNRLAQARKYPRPDSEMTTFEEDTSSPPEVLGFQMHGRGYAMDNKNFETRGIHDWQQELVPRSMTAPLEAVRPLDVRKTKSHQSFSQPLHPRTAASSVYSGHGSPLHSDSAEVQDLPLSFQPAQVYRPYNPYAPAQRESSGSITSMESAVQVESRATERRTVDLSPVAESPVGRSPVSYPRINKQRSPPRQPLFEPWRQAEIEAAKLRDSRTVEGGEQALRATASRERDMRDTAQRRNDEVHNKNGRPLLSQRRQNKLAPALDLGKEYLSTKQPAWRVAEGYERERVNKTGTIPITTQRRGNDL